MDGARCPCPGGARLRGHDWGFFEENQPSEVIPATAGISMGGVCRSGSAPVREVAAA